MLLKKLPGFALNWLLIHFGLSTSFLMSRYSPAPVIWFRLWFPQTSQKLDILHHQHALPKVLHPASPSVSFMMLLASPRGCHSTTTYHHQRWGPRCHQPAGDLPQKSHFKVCSKDTTLGRVFLGRLYIKYCLAHVFARW